MKANIRILTRTGGSDSSLEDVCELVPTSDGFAAHYLTEGEETILELSPHRVTMYRHGFSELSAIFSSDRSYCKMRHGGAETTFPAYMKSYHCDFGEKRIAARLIYDLELHGLQRFYLSISIHVTEGS